MLGVDLCIPDIRQISTTHTITFGEDLLIFSFQTNSVILLEVMNYVLPSLTVLRIYAVILPATGRQILKIPLCLHSIPWLWNPPMRTWKMIICPMATTTLMIGKITACAQTSATLLCQDLGLTLAHTLEIRLDLLVLLVVMNRVKIGKIMHQRLLTTTGTRYSSACGQPMMEMAQPCVDMHRKNNWLNDMLRQRTYT